MRIPYKKYKWAIIGYVIVTLILITIISLFFTQWQAQVASVLISVVFYPLLTQYSWWVYKRPMLTIRNEPEFRLIDLYEHDPGNGSPLPIWSYEVNGIVVENTGRSEAKNCKGWIVVGSRKERVCWENLPDENAVIGLCEEERLDLCAYRKEGSTTYKPTNISKPKKVPEIIAPTKEGWKSPFKARSLDNLVECEVWVTSNAPRVRAKVKIGKTRIEKIEII